jgi:hypothetical protein
MNRFESIFFPSTKQTLRQCKSYLVSTFQTTSFNNSSANIDKFVVGSTPTFTIDPVDTECTDDKNNFKMQLTTWQLYDRPTDIVTSKCERSDTTRKNLGSAPGVYTKTRIIRPDVRFRIFVSIFPLPTLLKSC